MGDGFLTIVNGEKLRALLHAHSVVVLLFTDRRCVSSQRMRKILEELALEHGGGSDGIVFAEAKVDLCASRADENELVGRYGVRTLPTLLTFQHRRVVGEMSGAREAHLRLLVGRLTPSSSERPYQSPTQ